MIQILAIGTVAGAAAGLLFGSVASNSLLSVLLFYLAPLPIMIAALGWSHWAAVVAALLASVSFALVFGGYFLAAFLIGVGLPAWWLGYRALMARPSAPGSVEWYPVGRLVVWGAVLASLVVTIGVINFGTDLESFRTALRSAFERVLREQSGSPPGTPLDPADPSGPDRLFDFLVVAIPPIAAALTTFTSLVNLWLAGRIVRVSGRLKRPWPDLAAMSFPSFAPALLAFALAASFLPGLPSVIGLIVAASLLMAYAILGFAVLHMITGHMNSRSFILAGAYASVLFLGWPMIGMMLLGLADTALDVRGRLARKRGLSPPSIR